MALESYHGRSWFSRILPSLRDRPSWASEDQLWTVVRRNPLECLTLLDPSGRRTEATKHVREREGKAAAFVVRESWDSIDQDSADSTLFRQPGGIT